MTTTTAIRQPKRLNVFERCLSLCGALHAGRCPAESGAALATVVGVLIEVPVMLSVCAVCNHTHRWFPAPAQAG